MTKPYVTSAPEAPGEEVPCQTGQGWDWATDAPRARLGRPQTSPLPLQAPPGPRLCRGASEVHSGDSSDSTRSRAACGARAGVARKKPGGRPRFDATARELRVASSSESWRSRGCGPSMARFRMDERKSAPRAREASRVRRQNCGGRTGQLSILRATRKDSRSFVPEDGNGDRGSETEPAFPVLRLLRRPSRGNRPLSGTVPLFSHQHTAQR